MMHDDGYEGLMIVVMVVVVLPLVIMIALIVLSTAGDNDEGVYIFY